MPYTGLSKQRDRLEALVELFHRAARGCPHRLQGMHCIATRLFLVTDAWLLQNLHKGVLRDQELYLLKKAEQKLLKSQQAQKEASQAK